MEDGIQTWVLDQAAGVLNIPVSEIALDRKFTEVGGNSLLAVKLSAACLQVNVRLSVETILGSESVAAFLGSAVSCAAVRNQSPQHALSKKEDVPSDGAKLVSASDGSQDLSTSQSTNGDLSSDPIGQGPPMTEIQLSLIHGTKRYPSRNIISYFETHPTDRLPIIRRAWNTVVSMEPIFRTKFELRNGAHLVEQSEAPFLWTEKTVKDQESYQTELGKISSLLQLGQDGYCDLMVANCFDIVTLSDDETGSSISTVIWRIHHALIDGYSAMLVLQKVRRVAAGLAVQASPSFVTLAKSLRHLQTVSKTAAQAFWRQQYAAYPSARGDLLLSSPQSVSDVTEMVSFQMPLDVSDLANKMGVTVATMCYAAWALTLTLFTDSDVVLLGAVFSGRNLPLLDVEKTVGPLVNTLPMHVHVDRSQTVKQFLQQIFKQLVNLASFQWTLPEHGYNRQFSSALSMQLDTVDAEGDDYLKPIEKPYSFSETDIPISIFIEADGNVRIQYNSGIFHRHDMKSVSDHYQRALTIILNSTTTIDQCLKEIPGVETHRMLRILGNCTSAQTCFSDVQDDLISTFERAVSQNPNHIALQRGNEEMTYSQLETESRKVAQRLEPFIEEGDVVCLHADRSLEWIVGIYGILFAGGVYCPIDAGLPQTLRDSYFSAAGGKAFLFPSVDQLDLKPAVCTAVLSVEESMGESVKEEVVLKTREANPLASAYICFTSGSTGKPKGVICTHAGLVAFQKDLTVRLMAQPEWKVAQTMSPAFDGSIHEIFSALSYGATLVLPHSADPFAHLKQVNSCILTPSVAKALDPAQFPLLNTVYLVGEPVPQEVNNNWSLQKTLYNMYGPTEGTGGATIKRLLPGHPVTIGSPNPSTRIYIMDRNLSLVPPGVSGEICLAGVQIARGYIGLPLETSERFRPDPVYRDLGEMMYRTGDHGYWDIQTGEIVCLGRKDRQMKLRGFRVDLNDLEIRMQAVEPALSGVAIAPNGDYLVALVTPSSINTTELASRVRTALPVHALPKYIIAVDKFPMTPAGKLDYKAVANSTPMTRPTDNALTHPLTATEKRVARLWEMILSLDQEPPITRTSNFFDLGGHSVMQLHLSTRLNDEFRCRIPFKLVVECPTIQQMAENIDRLVLHHKSSRKDSIISHKRTDEHELASIELEWWHKYQLDEGSSAFNVCLATEFDPSRVDRLLLTAAWNAVLFRHRILRSRYIKNRRTGILRKYADSPPQVQRLTHLNIWKEVNRPFDLANNNPIRVIISRDTLLIVVSHIVCDLTTLELLNREVMTLYQGEFLLPVDHNYMQVVSRNSILETCDLDFWTKYMSQPPEQHDSFAVDFDRNSYRGSSVVHNVPLPTFQRMLEVVLKQRMSLHQLALAAVALTMQVDHSNIDIVLGGPHLNRKTCDAQETVGLFLEPLPIRIKDSVPAPQTTEDFLQNVKHSSQQALGHAVPWNQLLCHLGILQDYPNHPMFDIMVTFHDNRQKNAFPLPGFESLNVWSEGAKFKLLFEFAAISDEQLTLRIEHDQDCYPTAAVDKIGVLLLKSLQMLGEGQSYNTLRKQIAADL